MSAGARFRIMRRMDSHVVSDQTVYEGPICRVHKVGLKMDTGEVVPRDLIEFADAVVVVPVRPDGAIVLIRNQRFAVGEELLELPAGKIEPGEAPSACAARELTEETGYTAGRLEPLGGFYSCPGAATEYLHVFLAADLAAGAQRPEAHERIRVEPTSPETMAAMVRSGRLHDAKSIAAWALWRLREEA